MQIETTVRYHLIPVRMITIKKCTNNKCWGECGEKGAILHCWWECKLVQPLWKTVWRFLKKQGIKPLYDPAIPLLGIYPEKTKIQKDTCTSSLIVALLTIVCTWKQARCPSTDEWIKKLEYTYAMKYYSAIKRNDLSQSSEVDKPRACDTEWSKSKREKQISSVNAYIESLQKWCRWTYLQGRNRDTNKRTGRRRGWDESGE